MRLLLDTHALLWWAHEPDRLSVRAHEAILNGENAVMVSAVSAMEIATKSRLGKLEYATPFATDFAAQMKVLDFGEIPVSGRHAECAGGLPGEHRDPWDRLLAAQAYLEDMTLVSKDSKLAGFGARLLW